MAKTKKIVTKKKTSEGRPEVDPGILVWVSRNYGISARIAKEIGTTSQFVSLILSGRRKGDNPLGAKVLAALKKAGAPIK